MSQVEVVDGTCVRFSGAECGLPLIFIHAFGDSGYCYEGVTSSGLLDHFRLITIDLWGFGSSPRRPEVRTVGEYCSALEEVLAKVCTNRVVGLIGHSIAGSMAVEIAARGELEACGVFSIEGNLTPDDAMFTGKAANYDDPLEFKESFLAEIWAMGEDSDELRHYYSAARIANPESMWHLGRDAKETSADGSFGAAFQNLTVPKLYYWSQSSTPENTSAWIQRSGIPNEVYTDAGHWPMVSRPEATAESIARFFDRSSGQ